jgi:hypothetical protein
VVLSRFRQDEDHERTVPRPNRENAKCLVLQPMLWAHQRLMPELAKCYRCPWVDLTKRDYIDYHDREWAVPVHNDRRLFEFLVRKPLKGLSWYTVLRKRNTTASPLITLIPQSRRYGEPQVQVLGNPGIIRNRQSACRHQ